MDPTDPIINFIDPKNNNNNNNGRTLTIMLIAM